MKKLRSAFVYTAIALGAIATHPLPGLAAPDALDGLRTGEMRKLSVLDSPRQLKTTVEWLSPDGPVSLADYSGKWVVLNFWAVWCAPCREEMPTLSALQRDLGGDDFAVVTLASGPNKPEAVDSFLAENGAANLPRLRDPNTEQARDAGVFGLPVTVLVNPQGAEVARLIGGADWNSPEARAVIAALRQ
ncbi:TlpA family protein disulfide reductase [Pseudooceanicola sediminis]|uniref:TlpA family protein disulfide reductase n=1 Tax=Pseudooceanicola sediminis TaxID=2211117 RepID=A0A399J4W0_9RHOB|nr:TlpA disulfide reductase family protein [Pseudooceanicola sediminis]KAA2314614.1 TlpA family protein disulfide reductase [Puniceibacterium sp. HSS470]RII39429.1 TlpA family protein disulfide reductase [Pseudooceanicola sediminis]|tara:strand:+ start:15496 stop:16062 length:567 start_codon:yes stop_codon:yes gene_type:complete